MADMMLGVVFCILVYKAYDGATMGYTTYQLTNGSFVSMRRPVSECENTKSEMKKGSTVTTTAPWGQSYDVARVICGDESP